jgi:gamma-glutamyltranspeptidase/glutathione hydrolase
MILRTPALCAMTLTCLALASPQSMAGEAAAPPTKGFSALRGDRASGWLAQTRSEVIARNGVVTTSQPLAAQAGLEILRHGGNAFDAAIATAAVLNVVEPASAGIGGDVFMLAWSAREHRLIAINGSGRAPAGLTPSHLAAKGITAHMPEHGIDSATVPGAVDAWDAILRRAGTLHFREVLQPAIDIAEQGFGVSQRIASDWSSGAEVLATDPDSVHTYLPDGRPPAAYQVFRNPDLAHAFRVLQRQGRDAYYKGEIAHAIVAKSRSLGGTMTLDDLARTHADWVEPIGTNYHGYDVYEMPPNTQGFAVLEMMNILEACAPRLGIDLAALGPASPQYWHLLVEAKKLAYADLYANNADPGFVPVPVEKLTSKAYAAGLCARIDPQHAGAPDMQGDPVGGTVYLATADRWGNMVSFIYSIYDGFGSGVTVPGYGFVLNDRGALFSLNAQSPNVLAGGKRPFHTLIPGFVMHAGEPWMAYGLMGGSQQAQGHMQVLVDLIDLGANPQAASDAARFAHAQASNTLYLETSLHEQLGAALRALGHHVESADGEGMGGYQAIRREGGVYRAASDHRKDGQAAGW